MARATWRRWPQAALLGSWLVLAGPVFAADPLGYRLLIAPTGDAEIDQALQDASRLAGLRDAAPVGPFALLTRADVDALRLNEVLRSFGHYDGRVAIRIAGLAIADPDLLGLLEALPDGAETTIEIAVDPGPLYRIGLARLEGPVPPAARDAFRLAPGQPARAREVLAAGEAVLGVLQEDGFALARVPPPDALVDHDTRTMEVVFVAEPGPRVTLGAVTIRGLERLRESYVRRRLGLEPGEPFRPSRLEEARRDLLAGQALAWARLTPGREPDAAGQLPLTLEVAERPRRVVRVAGAFASDEGATLSASWTHRNLWGRAERLTLSGEMGRIGGNRLDSLTYLTSAGLTIPDLGRRDLDLRLDLGAVRERLDAYDRDAVTAGVALEQRLAPGASARAGIAFERARITQEGPPEDYWLLSLPLALSHDSTDDPLDPRRGLRLAGQLTPTQVIQGQGDAFVLARAAGSTYLDLAELAGPGTAGRSVLAGRLVLGSLLGATAAEVPADWRFYAGGGGSVRGYPFQSIGPRTPGDQPAGGDGLLEAALELRQRWGANWGAVAFADAGAVSRDGVPGTGALAVGLGLGLRYFTPIGPVRVDIAAPLDPGDDDPPVQLYIGIGQAF